jgi:hypothetical protein
MAAELVLVPGNLYKFQYVGGREYDPDLYDATGFYLGERLNFYCFAKTFNVKENICGYIYYVDKSFQINEDKHAVQNIELYNKVLNYYNAATYKDPVVRKRISPYVYFELA